MVTPLLTTKLYIPPVRPDLVPRPRLVERLNAGLDGKLTLISAPAGFGKTTLLSEWAAGCGRPVAWVSLDEGDNDTARFLAYSIGALQTLEAGVGEGVLSAFQTPQPPPMETVLTHLINEVAATLDPFALVLDDYHVIEAEAIHEALTFLLDHLPWDTPGHRHSCRPPSAHGAPARPRAGDRAAPSGSALYPGRSGRIPKPSDGA